MGPQPQPWAAVDIGISSALPAGRLVAGTTLTALGPLTVVGVCIPWRDAHMPSGRKDRSQLAGAQGVAGGVRESAVKQAGS